MNRPGSERLRRVTEFVKMRIGPLVPWASLVLGIWSAFGVVRHYEQARWVAWMLAGVWVVYGVLVWLRHATRRGVQMPRWMDTGTYALAWTAQNLSQEILFFVLPFWIRSTTWDSHNAPFTILLILLAVATTLDPVYLGWIVPRTWPLLLHKSLVVFAGAAFVIPVLLGAHTVHALALAGAFAGLVASLPMGAKAYRWRKSLAGVALGAVLAVGLGDWIAPVPLRIERGVLTSGVRDRRPVDTLHVARTGTELWAWTPVFAPAGLDDTILHIWTRDGRDVSRIPLALHGGRKEGFRTWSSSRRAAAEPGHVELDVATTDGQLIGSLTIPVR